MHPLTLLAVTVAGIIISLPLLKLGTDTFIKVQAARAVKQLATSDSEGSAPRDPLLAEVQTGKPVLVYFTGAHCGPCKLVQKPVIQQLARDLGDSIQIIEVDIEQQMDAALRWGVMKVPRTFVLDRNLKVHTTNLDVTLLATLKQQIAEAADC